MEELLNLVRNQNRPSGGTFTDDDVKAALMTRVNKAITKSGFVSNMSGGAYPSEIVYKANRRDGGPQFEVKVPVDTPFESVEEVVRAQMPVQQTTLPPGVAQSK